MDFAVAIAQAVDTAHAAKRAQLVLQRARQFAQRGFRRLAVQHHDGHREVCRLGFHQQGFFQQVCRQSGLGAVYGALQVSGHFGQLRLIRLGVGVDLNQRHAFGAIRAQFANTVDRLQLFLQRHSNAELHFLGAGAGPQRGDGKAAVGQVGGAFNGAGLQAVKTQQNAHDHHQIDDQGAVDKPSVKGLHG